ncbi:MAG: ATP-grasp domain-containing protein [Firmicutes bacterium]|nr:ATP-grasp domain-containing protein [Bacillota bacterium]MDY3091999.1 ATP-grasp domain-containing protein [Erysipelotrichaceae bacterium]
MNFVFISPHFPENFYHFCESLKRNGVNVLGIGDTDYNNLRPELKSSLNEYYRVNSLENYNDVFHAVAYFTYKYGKIDWLESMNEYWLLQDARLRTDFNITSGIRNDQIDFIKYKSEMKALYELAGVKTARYHVVDNYENTKAFIAEVGYPVIVKPNNGVGASHTYKIKSDEELDYFFATRDNTEIIMEEFINGELVSYDGIANSKREVIYETSHVFPRQVMNIVNEQMDCFYWSRREIPEDLKDAGRRVIKAFPSNSRCFHCEFFVLNEDKEGLGKKGDILGLEVNMRTPGGITPDMMNYAADINIFDIYANMVCYDEARIDTTHKKYYCVYASRRKEHHYNTSLEDVKNRYAANIVTTFTNAPAIATAMGDYVLVARFENEEDIIPFVNSVIEGI